MQDSRADDDLRRITDAVVFAASAGQEMLLSSPTVSEVVVRIREFTRAIGLPECSVDASLSSITVSYWRPGLDRPVTIMRSALSGSPDLTRLSATLDLLHRTETGDISISAARQSLDGLRSRTTMAAGRQLWTTLLAVAGWVVFIGGFSITTILVAMAASAATVPMQRVVDRAGLPEVFKTAVAATVLAVVPNLAAAAGLAIDVGPAVVGGLFMYLPGLAVVSSVIDGLEGSPVAALSRGLAAVVTAAALALGMLAGSALGAGLGLDYQPDATSAPVLLSMAGAAIGMLGMALNWQAPRGAYIPILIMGSSGWFLVDLVTDQGSGIAWIPYGIAALAVGMLGMLAAGRRQSSPSIYLGVSIMPLVPGFALYQAMLAVAQREGDVADRLTQIVIISIAIAMGVAVGFALARNLIRGRRHLMSRIPARS